MKPMFELRGVIRMNTTKEIRALKSLLKRISPEASVRTEQLPLSTLVAIAFPSEHTMNAFITDAHELELGEIRWHVHTGNGN